MKPLSIALAALFAALLVQAPAHAGENPVVVRLNQRLQALVADPATRDVAAYERLQARQAVDALAAVPVRSSPQLAPAQRVAEIRVETAEIAARTALNQRQIDQLDRERSDLLVEASRRDATRARQEAERLRMQAQVQAEEAERLRQQAGDDAAARQDAETALDDVAGAQAAKLRAARKREAELARREAELTGAQPPPDKPKSNKP